MATLNPTYGYEFGNALFCGGCIEGALGNNTYSELHSPEEALTLIADDEGIDRSAPTAFTSDAFPVALCEPRDAKCSDCGSTLDINQVNITDTRTLCGANHAAGEDCFLSASPGIATLPGIMQRNIHPAT